MIFHWRPAQTANRSKRNARWHKLKTLSRPGQGNTITADPLPAVSSLCAAKHSVNILKKEIGGTGKQTDQKQYTARIALQQDDRARR